MQFAQSFIGVLQPGAWAYYTLDLTSSESRDKPLTVEFDNNAGQSIVLGSFDSYPTLLDTNFTFRCRRWLAPRCPASCARNTADTELGALPISDSA